MKVLQVVAGNLDEGAAKGAYILHENLISAGISSVLLTNSLKTQGYREVYSVSDGLPGRVKAISRMKLDNTYKLFYEDKKSLKFSPGMTGYDFTKTDLYKESDIVHLHWICNGFVDIKDLSSVEKPIVWTLRDMWPMTGGCHYSVECEKYTKECGACPHLGSEKNNDLSTFLQKRKKRYYPAQITFVGISKWITDQAQKSSLLKNSRIETISNNIDLNNFFPSEQKAARDYFQLHGDKPILLFGAQYLNSVYKGYDILIEILQKLNLEAEIVFFGRQNPAETDHHGVKPRYLGFLEGEDLRKAYTASDVFISPSRMEAFGKTVAESMACGTPAVCFNDTGSADIVDHKINGYLADPFSAEDMITGIRYILNHQDYPSLSKAAAGKAKRFDAEVITKEYIDLYHQLSGEN